ncbi:hypothetical protein B0H14DRAFT_2838843 [Mycena olivaceomarginata]|nr:hypothetical protein B0H14DRAFT_2838843 [Mycena olivaceomarginata]
MPETTQGLAYMWPIASLLVAARTLEKDIQTALDREAQHSLCQREAKALTGARAGKWSYEADGRNCAGNLLGFAEFKTQERQKRSQRVHRRGRIRMSNRAVHG